MLPYCQKLSIKEKPLIDNPDLSIFRGKGRNFNVSIVEKHMMNPKMLELIKSVGLVLKRMTVFYKSETYVDLRPHIDFDDITDFARLNWIYGGNNSQMRWFNVINPNIETSTRVSLIGAPYHQYERDNVELAYATNITTATLVQSCIPHDVLIGDEERFAISMILKTKESPPDQLLTMSQALEAFKDYIE